MAHESQLIMPHNSTDKMHRESSWPEVQVSCAKRSLYFIGMSFMRGVHN